MKLSVIGAGYVGLTTAACLAEIGHVVSCADNDQDKLELLRNGKVPFFEPHLAKLVSGNRKAERLRFETPEDAVARAHGIFICVGTPPLENGDADLSAVANVARTIARYATGDCLVIEKSTVPVQTAQQLKKQLQVYARDGLRCQLASNPEFLREGSAIRDFFHPDRIVIGIESQKAASLLYEIYAPVLDQTFACPVHLTCSSNRRPEWVVTDTNSAELIKHASNSFLAMKISFINMVADLCEEVGGDVAQVARGLGMDSRIGPDFLNPGIGFGGFCFPKDIQAFARIGAKAGCDFTLLKEVENINKRRIESFVDKIREELWVLQNRKIAVLGLAFKPNTDDIRFSPAIEVIRALIREGAQVSAYDPEANERAKVVLPELRYCSNPYDAARGAEAVVITTEWEEFKELDWTQVRGLVARPLIVDGRNTINPAEVTRLGFDYLCIGRQPVLSSDHDGFTASSLELREVGK
jgi:UDPglucose 6-dehydrogenase